MARQKFVLLVPWVDEQDLPELKRMVARFAKLLDQESMYLESAGPGSSLEFIEPQAEEGKKND